MAPKQPWLTIIALSIPSPPNPLPTHLEETPPKFDPDKDILPEDHIKQFMLPLNLMNVQHEDVVCRLFYFNFQGKASSWFFSLSLRSITSCKQFEIAFMTKFGDNKTSGILFLEISKININKNENVKDFNHRVITLLNRIPDKPTEVVQIEVYTITLLPLVSMFVKRKEKKNFGG